MLIFIGLGLHGEGISLQGLREAQRADVLYAELYTSLVPSFNLKKLEREIGKLIQVVGREAGLQSYKFGRTTTVPFPDNPSQVPYETLVENRKRGLHTLLLLDIRAKEERAMLASEAIEIMLGLEEKLRKNAFTPDTLVVVVARAGSDDAVVKADRVGKLRGLDFGPPPHVLIVPGKLHFVEAEALRVFAEAPEAVAK